MSVAAYSTLLAETRGPAAWLILNRPEKQNAITPQMTRELTAALRAADGDPAVRVVVLTGAGEKAFCAGGDLGGESSAGAQPKASTAGQTTAEGGRKSISQQPGPVERHQGHREFAGLARTLVGLSKPTVARVNGHALGGGFGIAAGCDITVAVPEATLGTPEASIGLFPYIIMATLYRTTTRPKRLLEMMLLGQRIPADEARDLGWVNHVVPREKLDAKVGEVVDGLASKSPAVLALGRRAFYDMREMEFDRALDYLAAQLSMNMTMEDFREGVVAFMTKKTPKWKGR